MHDITAEIVTIGDEILYGQITDTNSQWLSEQLDLLGIKVKRKISVGDEMQELLQILRESESRVDIILLTGGLGPTSDDITKPALCQYFGCGLKTDEKVLDHITGFFVRRNRPMLEANKKQAEIPTISEALFNRLGTAPGIWIERKGKIFISLPGVPYEMKEILTTGALPRLKTFFQTPIIYHKMVRTVGIPESFLAETIKDWECQLPSHIKLAYLPSPAGVKLRLTAKGNLKSELEAETAHQIDLLQQLIGPYIYGYDGLELEQAIGHLLKEKGRTLATAESCTGGAVAALVTSVSGSSAYFLGSVVAYSNEVKEKLLGVKFSTLEKYGAVSEQTVIEMAEGVRHSLGSDIGIATTGVAGPTGGTSEKPVGTVWIAYSDATKTIAKKLPLTSERSLNIKLTVTQVLNLLRENLI